MSGETRAVSERSRGVALALGVLGGFFGLHRFYTGHTRTGTWMALTLGGLGVWYLYDVVLIAAGDFTDAGGRPVVQWGTAHGPPSREPATGAVAELEDRLRRLESHVSELGERVDFAERLLARPPRSELK